MTLSINQAWDTDRYEYYLKSRWYAGTLRINLSSNATADSNQVDLFEFKRDYDLDGSDRVVYYKSSSTTYDIYIYLSGYSDVSYAELFNNNNGLGHNIGFSTFAGTYSDPPVGYIEASYASANGFWSANGNSIFNNNSGNVGIGTQSPRGLVETYSANGSSLRLTSNVNAPLNSVSLLEGTGDFGSLNTYGFRFGYDGNNNIFNIKRQSDNN